jgi:hypothetical protein
MKGFRWSGDTEVMKWGGGRVTVDACQQYNRNLAPFSLLELKLDIHADREGYLRDTPTNFAMIATMYRQTGSLCI